MKRKLRTLLAVLFLISASRVAQAASINVATGLDASNNLLTTGGALDAHWIVQEQAGGTGAAQVVVPSSADWGPTWVNNGPNSDWIARNANVADQGPAPYTFSNNYQLVALDPAKRSHAIVVQPVALASATYSHATLPASATYGPFAVVTLTLSQPMPRRQRMQLTVFSSPSAIAGVDGLALDGNASGQPGGNYVVNLD